MLEEKVTQRLLGGVSGLHHVGAAVASRSLRQRAHAGIGVQAHRQHHVNGEHQRHAIEHHIGRHLLKAQRIAQQAQHHHDFGERSHHHPHERGQRHEDDGDQR